MDGFTAVKHYNSNPTSARVMGMDYYFTPRANISMAWVQNDHVDAMLSIKKSTCCGNKKHPKFRIANEDDIRRWINGGGR